MIYFFFVGYYAIEKYLRKVSHEAWKKVYNMKG